MVRRKNEEKKKLAQFRTCAGVRDRKRKRREHRRCVRLVQRAREYQRPGKNDGDCSIFGNTLVLVGILGCGSLHDWP